MPQRRFASIHVVGTNGKSSVTELAAALLEANGTSTGAYLSPHDERWSQRVLLGGAEIARAEFAEAVARVAEAMPAAERGLEEGDAVTQFEAATAAAFVAFAAAGVEVAVVEAGLGGRLDATNVLPSRVTALTSIGLEHTEYLGETELEIAAEKLAVLSDHSVLVAGERSTEPSGCWPNAPPARGTPASSTHRHRSPPTGCRIAPRTWRETSRLPRRRPRSWPARSATRWWSGWPPGWSCGAGWS